MTRNDLVLPSIPMPSPSRIRYVETRLEADAEAILREVAYVMALTQRVKREMLGARPERATADA
jgi:hypothetical protein